MAKRQVFYSFHYDNDVFRVQQIRNIGSLEDNKPVSTNDWETVKRGGDSSIKRWIDNNLLYKSCLVVLVGSDTSNRRWVKYEIEKAWNDGRAVLGIYIHNLRCPRTGVSRKGANPFDSFTINQGKDRLSSIVKCYDPNTNDAYRDIANNIEKWIEEAINNKANL
jgi:hypothetical protein